MLEHDMASGKGAATAKAAYTGPWHKMAKEKG
jgi:hypothetical protein